ncbi:MAG: hypothetical protein KDA61_11830, partial [Planctomycetales bacterium]|nr:hypothetical protein [Planctomycetales bacterium]
GDFDGDADVDGHDFLFWQRGLSPTPLSSADLGDWQANFATPLAPLESPVEVATDLQAAGLSAPKSEEAASPLARDIALSLDMFGSAEDEREVLREQTLPTEQPTSAAAPLFWDLPHQAYAASSVSTPLTDGEEPEATAVALTDELLELLTGW